MEQVVLTCCSSCKEIVYPRRVFCPKCYHEEFEEVKLSDGGYIYSYCIVHKGATSQEMKVPYCCGYVDMAEGVRLFGIINTCSEQVHVGMKVVIQSARVMEEGGYEYTMFNFLTVKS